MIFVGEKIAIKTWKVNSVICCGPSKPISHMLTDRFQACGGARVIRILCTSMKTLRKCLVEVILY